MTKMKSVCIGIDPGKSGGLCALDTSQDNPSIHDLMVMPTVEKDVDLIKISTWMYDISNNCDNIMVYIEKVHSMPKQGVASTFTFGFWTGALHGIVAALQIPRFMVTPQQWKKLVLAGMPKTKSAAIEHCLRSFPGVNLLPTPRSTKLHDGLADAICIASYGNYINKRK